MRAIIIVLPVSYSYSYRLVLAKAAPKWLEPT